MPDRRFGNEWRFARRAVLAPRLIPLRSGPGGVRPVQSGSAVVKPGDIAREQIPKSYRPWWDGGAYCAGEVHPSGVGHG